MNKNPHKASYHILLVEDNPADVQLLQVAFSTAELCCELTVINDGAQALQFVRDHDAGRIQGVPDLAILDLNVPKNDGLEVLAAIRASAHLGSMPVVALTSSSSPREAAKLQGLSVCRHLVKPLDLDAFMNIGVIVRHILEESELWRR